MNLHETTVIKTGNCGHQRREPLKMKEFSQQPSKAMIKSEEESLKTRFSHGNGRFIANEHENRHIRFFACFNRKMIDFYNREQDCHCYQNLLIGSED